MSDDTKQEQPSAGGSYIRRPNGSLVRQNAPAETETSDATATTDAPAARSKKRN